MFDTIISVEELGRNFYNPNWIILDCRGELSVPEAGRNAFAKSHIPSAQHCDLKQDLSGRVTRRSGRHPLPPADRFQNRLRHWGVNNQSQIIAYDDKGGAFAARLWWMIKWMGHAAVAVLDGGLPAWTGAGYALEAGPATPRPKGKFSGRPHKSMTVNAPYIMAHLGTSAYQKPHSGKANKEGDNLAIIDARSHVRFTGKDKTTDPIIGHIPGAYSRAFTGNLTPDGRFQSPDVLRARFNVIPGHDVINMCGSGVTGCHNILARSVAGLPIGRLFVGSWSEWIRDPSRPVVQGED